jgi:hypothetical protein
VQTPAAVWPERAPLCEARGVRERGGVLLQVRVEIMGLIIIKH